VRVDDMFSSAFKESQDAIASPSAEYNFSLLKLEQRERKQS